MGAGPNTMFLTRCVRAAGALPSTMLLIFLWRATTPELVIAIAEWLCVTRTAPHCDRGSLRRANQVATGAGKAFAYGTGAERGSHLAKLRDGVPHCNSVMDLSFLLLILTGVA